MHYPVYLNLRNRLCVVVGGDAEAESRVRALLASAARVRVIAAEVNEELRRLATEGQIELIAREYRSGDLAGAFLVIATTTDPKTNEAIWQEANQEKALLNIAGDSAHCTFMIPAILRRGNLCITVSTCGLSPALARRIRDRLAAEFGPEYGRFVEMLGQLRPRVVAAIPSFDRRKAFWYKLVDSEILELLQRGEEAAAWIRAEQILAEAASEGAES
ncbi:MAG: bifunctional precorrin-2 dehydrogenase/sirohydrochlorin ferrochelatase [Armatimonadota bacterium]|nr:bifunctional precorrin-2 dehydrogenase/sirohydrochlorin ferrochelatase [Armatimonadota bacterium]MDR5702242.1 bifunctional precorrin-2 dehydrogenase/sirohydrochlorin ferrochelatase [Armatimonadota bacterium]